MFAETGMRITDGTHTIEIVQKDGERYNVSITKLMQSGCSHNIGLKITLGLIAAQFKLVIKVPHIRVNLI